MSKIVYLYVKASPSLLLTMFVNSQQILFIILFICEVITLHKIITRKQRKQSPQLKTTLYYITHKLDYIDRSQSKTQRLDHTKNFILLNQDIIKRFKLR